MHGGHLNHSQPPHSRNCLRKPINSKWGCVVPDCHEQFKNALVIQGRRISHSHLRAPLNTSAGTVDISLKNESLAKEKGSESGERREEVRFLYIMKAVVCYFKSHSHASALKSSPFISHHVVLWQDLCVSDRGNIQLETCLLQRGIRPE